MDKFLIKGGKSLKGKIEVRGAKNAATPILAACLLTQEPCIIDNLPLIEDVFRMIEILKSMGVKAEFLSERKIKLQAADINPDKIDQQAVCKMRSSILVLGPLFARFGDFKIAHPGGCLIGARPVTAHFEGFKDLGAEINQDEQFYYFKKSKERVAPSQIILSEFSVTATENLMMAAALRPEKTVIKIAAAEPHVQDLGEFLIKMGVKIEGLGTHTLIIEGKEELSGAQHHLIYDPIEAGTFIIAAAATRGEVEVENLNPDHLDLVFEKLKEMGVNFKINQNSVFVKPSTNFKAAVKIQTLPYPGIPTDLQAPFAVLCTQANGTTLIHDPLYEGRFKYINELAKMGANAVIADPHRALITGPTPLYGTQITSYDLRAGATLIIAALVAEGESEISEIYQVDRGYEKIEERLQKLGADIKRIKE